MPDGSSLSFDDSTLESRVRACQQRIGYTFQDPELLTAALTHASGADHRLSSNERLEFLGDSILGFVICEELYRRFPQQSEGDLTKIKSTVVSRKTCAKVSRRLQLNDLMILGKGMSGDQPIPTSLYADVFEALVAAMYLDGGMEVARDFIREHIFPEIEIAASGRANANFKSQLQQVAQRLHGHPPNYLMLDEAGPDHCKTFKIAAQVGRTTYTAAWGKNKKDAEQRAAGNALAEMDGDPAPFLEIDDWGASTFMTDES